MWLRLGGCFIMSLIWVVDENGYIEVVAIKPSQSDVYFYHYIRKEWGPTLPTRMSSGVPAYVQGAPHWLFRYMVWPIKRYNKHVYVLLLIFVMFVHFLLWNCYSWLFVPFLKYCHKCICSIIDSLYTLLILYTCTCICVCACTCTLCTWLTLRFCTVLFINWQRWFSWLWSWLPMKFSILSVDSKTGSTAIGIAYRLWNVVLSS